MVNTVYTPFEAGDQVQGVPNRITNAMWSNGVGILTTMSIASTDPVASAGNITRYYYNVYGTTGAATASAQVEFSVAYGHVSGAGAPISDRDYPTKAIYGQYRGLLLDNNASSFTYISGSTTVTMSQFCAISIKRANLKQRLDAGNWELHLQSGSAKLHLIDNSGDSKDTNVSSAVRAYTVVSGTIAGGQVGSNHAYGLVYPDYGIILLDTLAISASVPIQFDYTSSNLYADNARLMVEAISASHYFAARSEENISSTHYFVRIKNQQYNYTSNPTFYSASDGTIINSNFYNNPQVFITTVGLYNDDNELLAVAKLSKPIAKGFDKEALIKCRLDF